MGDRRRATDGLGFGVVGEDEPVFIVRGCDAAAPDTIEAWARLALLHGAHPVVADHAGRWAARVREWQRVHGATALADATTERE